MSSRSPPVVPPRPARSPNPTSGPPKIPPRPSRRPDRSSPPKPDRHTPSPLNDPPQPADLNRAVSHEASPLSQPDRPPSVNTPSIGEEGRKRESLEYRNKGRDCEAQGHDQEPAETRSVNHDLYLHAPRPSLPSASAKEQVRVVTGTTAQQAAAAGIGRNETPEPAESNQSYVRESSADRPLEPEEEKDIPEIEKKVPLDPSAGDVRAPIPQDDEMEVPRETRRHSRTGASEEKSARDIEHDKVESQANGPLHRQGDPDEHGQLDTEKSQAYPDDPPILAADEVVFNTEHREPAVSTGLEQPPSSAVPEGQKPLIMSPGGRQAHQVSSPMRSGPGGEGDEESKLDNVQELSPLFPVNSKESQPPEDRLEQLPSHQQHGFPSKDVWEDAPESSQPESIVADPDVQRKSNGEDILNVSKEDMGPSELVTPKDTVQEPEQENHEERVTSSQVERNPSIPAIPPRPSKPTSSPFPPGSIQAEPEQEKQEAKVTSPEIERKPSIPSIPPRPSKSTASPCPPESVRAKDTSPTIEPRRAPAIPERPKPQVPARPSRPKSRGPNATLTKTTSAGSTESTEDAPKPKPEIPSRPARPASNKIASLQAGFLSDLNNRLKIGPKLPPQQEKKEAEQTVQKGPLSDARKGRARGPARRKPAATQAAPKLTKQETLPTSEIRLVDAWSAWHVGEDGVLVVGEKSPKSPEKPASKAVEEVPLSVAATEIIERKKASEKTQKAPDETTEEMPESAHQGTSQEEFKEDASIPRLVDGTQAPAFPTPSPKTIPPTLLSNVDVPNDLSLNAQAKPESKPEPEVIPDVKSEPETEVETKPKRGPEPEPEPRSESQPESESEPATELKPKILSELEHKPEFQPIDETKGEEPQEKPPSEEEMVAPPSPQEAIRKASQVVAEEGLDPSKSLCTEEKAAQMFP